MTSLCSSRDQVMQVIIHFSLINLSTSARLIYSARAYLKFIRKCSSSRSYFPVF